MVTDADDVQKQPLFTGYCYPGHELRGIGGFPLAPGDKIQINSWCSQASLVIRPAITVVRDAYFVGGWEGTSQRMDEGKGRLRHIDGTDPAVDTESSEAVPTNAKWELEEYRITLVTDANAADRKLGLITDDATTIEIQQAVNFTHTATVTRNYNFWAGAATLGNDTHSSQINVAFSKKVLNQGDRIRTTTANLQVGDNFGAPSFKVREWLTE